MLFAEYAVLMSLSTAVVSRSNILKCCLNILDHLLQNQVRQESLLITGLSFETAVLERERIFGNLCIIWSFHIQL